MLIMESMREPDDAFLIAMSDHQCPVAALEHLLEQHDLTDLVELEDLHYVHRLVDHHLLTGRQGIKINIRAYADAHLAAGGEDIRGVFLACGEEDCEAGWWLREPVNLILQGNDLVPRLTQRGCEALVVGGGGPGIRAGIGQPPFQHGDVVRMCRDPFPEPVKLVSERTDLGYQRFAVLVRYAIVDRSGHDTPPAKTLPGLAAGPFVIVSVRAARWATFTKRCCEPWCQSPSRGHKSGVAYQIVPRPHRQPFNVPGPDQGFGRLRLGE